jgi:hypothetical protein
LATRIGWAWIQRSGPRRTGPPCLGCACRCRRCSARRASACGCRGRGFHPVVTSPGGRTLRSPARRRPPGALVPRRSGSPGTAGCRRRRRRGRTSRSSPWAGCRRRPAWPGSGPTAQPGGRGRRVRHCVSFLIRPAAMALSWRWPVAVRRRRAVLVSPRWPISGRTQPRVRNRCGTHSSRPAGWPDPVRSGQLAGQVVAKWPDRPRPDTVAGLQQGTKFHDHGSLLSQGLTMKGTGHLTCGRIGCPPRTPGRGSARPAAMVRGGFRRGPARRRRPAARTRARRTRCRR